MARPSRVTVGIDVPDLVDAVIKQLVEAGTLVEVVRCRNCKHYLGSDEKCALIDTRLHFYETGNTWASDCYCAWGEEEK